MFTFMNLLSNKHVDSATPSVYFYPDDNYDSQAGNPIWVPANCLNKQTCPTFPPPMDLSHFSAIVFIM